MVNELHELKRIEIKNGYAFVFIRVYSRNSLTLFLKFMMLGMVS